MLHWGDVPGFLANLDVSPKSREKLKLLLQNEMVNLMIELAITTDAGEPFVKACYTLEGDGPLALTCHEVLSTVRASIQVKHWANTRAIAWKIAMDRQVSALEQQLVTYAQSCVQPGFDYFENKFGGELLPCTEAFKAANLILARSQTFIRLLLQWKV